MKKIYTKIDQQLLSGKATDCATASSAASNIADMIAQQFVNEMKGAEDDKHPCPCSGDGTGDDTGDSLGATQLIILVDSSTSMREVWLALEEALEPAIEKAQENCHVKREVFPELLFVDNNEGGTNPDTGNSGGGTHSTPSGTTLFTRSHEQFLRDAPNNFTGTFRTDIADGAGDWVGEQGAEAIADLSEHTSWREGACRAIFYVTDTWLDAAGRGAQARSQARVDEAVQIANANGVTLFTHWTGGSNSAQIAQMEQLANDTKGDSVTDNPTPSVPLYTDLLGKAICESCANISSMGCPSVDWPELSPCIHVTWGASECDKMESHDDEVVNISICNCYSNVTFEDVKLAWAVVVDEKGNLPPLLPDGSPSVHLYPTGPICFGDIGPCEEGEETCVSRQFVMLNRGARDGKYRIKLGPICFGTSQKHQIKETERYFEICKD